MIMETKKFDKGYYEFLDKLVNVAFLNLNTISKDDGIIRFSDVRYKDEKHWAMLNIINLACQILKREAYLDMPLIQYWKVRLRFHNRDMKRVRHNGGIKLDRFINDIESANLEKAIDPFYHIAQNYYPRKNK